MGCTNSSLSFFIGKNRINFKWDNAANYILPSIQFKKIRTQKILRVFFCNQEYDETSHPLKSSYNFKLEINSNKNMISAIILARCTSSRLPNKHFYQIGNKKIIDIIIHNLKSNKIISQIYLATGTKTKNFNFLKIAKKNKINIYFHNNEDNVTERIYKVTKKIKTKYSILISGDCCLVDNSFIKRLYKSIKLQNKDFVKSNDKLIHEGITLFKTDIWSK